MRLAPLLVGTALVGLLAPVMAAAPAQADAALVLGNGNYESLPDLDGGVLPARALGGIEALGFQVSASAQGNREEAGRALRGFMADVPEAERLLVVLSGRFVTDGGRTWFLVNDTAVPTLFGLNSNALSLESVMAVLARRPSQSVLMLGLDAQARDAFDPWLREGLGELDIPQGVTVIQGRPDAVAAFMEDGLGQPGGDLAALVAATPGLRADGYLPQGFAFMPDEPAPPASQDPEAARAAEAERALWQGAVALDTVEAYRDYLRIHPTGPHATEARAAVAAILSEPNRAARIEEESLRLSRDQRRQVQQDLASLDFDPRGVDGIFGAGTRAAITNWQQQAGFAQTGYLDAEQLGRLSDGAAEQAARAEAERQAAARADDDFWRQTGASGNPEELRAYLQRYPDGRHAEEAADRVALIDAAARAQADERAWEEASRENTRAAYGRYLETWPEGRWAGQAREGLQARRDAAVARSEAEAGEEALGLTPLTARVIEARLRVLDLDPGEVDGRLDGDAREAIRAYQGSRDLPATGYLSEATIVRLLADTVGQALGD